MVCVFPLVPPVAMGFTSASSITGVTILARDWNRGIIFKHALHIEGEFPYLESQRGQRWR